MICVICDKTLPDDVTFSDYHHLIPKSKKGKDVIRIHRICHNKIHSIWTEKELAKHYNTPDKIREHPDMCEFIAWVKNKPDDFYVKTRDSVTRKSKRRK